MEALIVKRDNDFTYPIYFENNFSGLAQSFRDAGLADKRICIVTDSNVAPLYLAQAEACVKEVCENYSVFVMDAGEPNKNLDTVQKVYTHLIENRFDRNSVLCALGGGVVGDLTGFTAATYLRGIPFVQVPTTLLAQVDSSVGGKTGVDMNAYKNMVGAFHQPLFVYMNFEVFRSLPEVEFICGIGEVVKTGLICDADLFRKTVALYNSLRGENAEELKKIVRRCCEIKAGVVERDPKEHGERALLNLGHTIGHAVEKLMDFKLHHGQCVGLGLISAAAISKRRGLLTEEEYNEILSGCRVCGLPSSVEGLQAEDVLAATKNDKKMSSGQIKFILMDGLGHSAIDKTVSDEELLFGITEILK